jgi:hypothetical protein
MTAISASALWTTVIKIANTAIVLAVPLAVTAGWWVVGRITDLEKNHAVVKQIVQQIRINTETLSRHEKQLSATDTALAALIRELGPLDQRIRLFVTRAEWELRNETRDREVTQWMQQNSQQHADICSKLDRLFEQRRQ